MLLLCFSASPSPSPGSSNFNPTPSPSTTYGTPSPSPGYAATPSPMGYSPMTPGNPFTPQTPGTGELYSGNGNSYVPSFQQNLIITCMRYSCRHCQRIDFVELIHKPRWPVQGCGTVVQQLYAVRPPSEGYRPFQWGRLPLLDVFPTLD